MSRKPTPSSSAVVARLHAARSAVLIAALFGVVFTADVWARPELGIALAYAVPVALATWLLGESAGLSLAALAAAAALAAPPPGTEGGVSAMLVFAALAVRALVLGVVVWGIYRLRRAHDRLVVLSERDELTGLLNRRAFRRVAEVELERAGRYRRPLSVAFLDLDAFKEINDAAGHHVGDRVLAAFGRVLRGGRLTDVAARLGGDEFVLLMPETKDGEAAAAIARLRQLADVALAREARAVTFTAGVVTFDVAPLSVDELLRSADARLYEAKRARGSVPGSVPPCAHVASGAVPVAGRIIPIRARKGHAS